MTLMALGVSSLHLMIRPGIEPMKPYPNTRDMDFRVDTDSLHRQETFTDLKFTTVNRGTPVRLDGSADPRRQSVFIGRTEVVAARGFVPIHGPIDARSLPEAFEKFPAAVKKAVAAMNAKAAKHTDR